MAGIKTTGPTGLYKHTGGEVLLLLAEEEISGGASKTWDQKVWGGVSALDG